MVKMNDFLEQINSNSEDSSDTLIDSLSSTMGAVNGSKMRNYLRMIDSDFEQIFKGIEYGFEQAAALGYKAVLVEGNPKNYNPRGFVTSADYGIVAGPDIHLPHVSCLMIKELVKGALDHIHGEVDYSFYSVLREG